MHNNNNKKTKKKTNPKKTRNNQKKTKHTTNKKTTMKQTNNKKTNTTKATATTNNMKMQHFFDKANDYFSFVLKCHIFKDIFYIFKILSSKRLTIDTVNHPPRSPIPSSMTK